MSSVPQELFSRLTTILFANVGKVDQHVPREEEAKVKQEENKDEEDKDVHPIEVVASGSSKGAKKGENEKPSNQGEVSKNDDESSEEEDTRPPCSVCVKGGRQCIPKRMGFACKWCHDKKKKCDHKSLMLRKEYREKKKEGETGRRKKQKAENDDTSRQVLVGAPSANMQSTTARDEVMGKLKKVIEEAKEIKDEMVVIKDLVLSLGASVKRIEEKLGMDAE